MPSEKLVKNKINMKLYGYILKFIIWTQKLYWKETFEYDSVLHVVNRHKNNKKSICNIYITLQTFRVFYLYFGAE